MIRLSSLWKRAASEPAPEPLPVAPASEPVANEPPAESDDFAEPPLDEPAPAAKTVNPRPRGADRYPELADMFPQNNGANYLYPTALRKTESTLRRVAIIGSCFMQSFRYHNKNPSGCPVDMFLVNNAGHPPEWPGTPDNPEPYDFLIVQIGLRFIAPDAVWRLPYTDPASFQREFDLAVERLAFQVKRRMEWNVAHGQLTFVTNFTVPQRNPMGTLFPRHDLRNPEYFVARLNEELERIVLGFRHAYILDLDRISASFGRRYGQDDAVAPTSHGALLGFSGEIGGRIEPLAPMLHHYDMSWPGDFSVAVWNEAIGMMRTLRGTDAVKMVVVDLDDTLWTGVIGEMADPGPDIVAGWQIGFIEALGQLRQRGILLGILSKNEESRIRAVWRRVFGARIKLEDFAALAINWQPKAENMRTMLAGVNLLPRNVVFIDDNPAERDAMQRAFPDLRVLGRHPYYLRHTLLWAAETQVTSLTEEGAKRTEMVQAQLRREEDRGTISEVDFLRAAAPSVSCAWLRATTDEHFPRAAELVGKTNQFNTTGRRWSSPDWSAFFARGGTALTFSVTDAYTQYGLVGVVLVESHTIEQFVMSCRVLGYGIEQAVLAHLTGQLRAGGAGDIVARLVETDANFPCRDVYAKAGFGTVGQDWLLPASSTAWAPPHVRIDQA